jgi:uncharacterized protein (DUF1697 family)
MKTAAYIAFLRGINVGGNALIKMTKLKEAFEGIGFKAVTPVLASGNIVFETSIEHSGVLKQRVEKMLKKQFGIEGVAILRSQPQILELLKLNPFQGTKLLPETKVQVTFLGQETKTPGKTPIRLPIEEFKIVQVSAGEVVSAVDLSTNARTPDLMRVLERHFGKNITTRTWNTVEKIGKLFQG